MVDCEIIRDRQTEIKTFLPDEHKYIVIVMQLKHFVILVAKQYQLLSFQGSSKSWNLNPI